MSFIGNNGSYGGAIALYECSYIVLYNETKLTFCNNIAITKGQAIHSGVCNKKTPNNFQQNVCFII